MKRRPQHARRRSQLCTQVTGKPRGEVHHGYRLRVLKPDEFYRRHGSVVHVTGADWKETFDKATAIYGPSDAWTIEAITEEEGGGDAD